MGTEVGLKIATFFAPDDDTQAEFLKFLQGTQGHLRIAIYGFHLPGAVDVLAALHKAGKDVALVVDHTQARGTYERPEIQQMRSIGIPLLEGTSQKHHIMHHKFAVRDHRHVLAGSWNFSESARAESNYFDVVESTERASLFLAKWQEMWDWIDVHEQKYQG